MENTNSSANQSQGDGLAAAKALFADYKTQGSDKPKKLSNEERLAKYFVPRREKETFRILPPKAGRKHVETAFFHVVKTNAAGGQKKWRKIYCPQHNDPHVQKTDANGDPVLNSDGKPFLVPAPCSICAKKKEILAKQDSSLPRGKKREELNSEQQIIFDNNKELYKTAMNYDAKQFYIIKGIDRNSTGDGVKFWRFKHNYKKQGIYDKLVPALENFMEQNQTDFADPIKGCDLLISVVDNQIPGSTRTFRDVSNIMARNMSPLAEDELLRNQWLSDESTWRDVYKKAGAPEMTTEEYYDRIIRGTDPYWDATDTNNKKWVYPDPRDEEKEKKANTRDMSLGSNLDDTKIKQASDLASPALAVVNESYDNVNINNVTKEDAGEYEDDAEDLSGSTQQSEENNVSVTDQGDDDSYDDLPF